MFFKSDLEKAKERKIEEYYFDIVAQELEQNIKHNPAWAKAISKSKGDIEIAKSYYIDYRIQSLKDDAVLQEEINNQKKAKKLIEEEKQEQERKWKKDKEREKQRKEDDKSLLNPYVAFLLFCLAIIGLKYLLTWYNKTE